MINALILFSKDKDSYNLQKQVDAICKENTRLHERTLLYNFPTYYATDVLESAIQNSIMNGAQKIVILHEDNLELEPLDHICRQEYGRYVERIDVLPEGYGILREAQNEGNSQQYCYFINFLNPPVKGSAPNFEKLIEVAKTINDRVQPYSLVVQPITYQPESQKNIFWCSNTLKIILQYFTTAHESDQIKLSSSLYIRIFSCLRRKNHQPIFRTKRDRVNTFAV